MSTSLGSNLQERARLLAASRQFFAERGVLEVDCPALSPFAPVDLHIDVMQVHLKGGEIGYLHTSPEYGMKRLLAEGIGDIYQLGHVFRDGENGPWHHPEFTMTEWYRIGFTFEQMIEETLAYIRLFLGDLPKEELTYQETVRKFLGINYRSADLIRVAKERGIDLPENASSWDRDTLLQLLISFLIEPHLGKDSLFVLSYFPATQAALAKVAELPGGEKVACRFEIYYRGIELANGYHELTDPVEQLQRFEASNAARVASGKDPLKIDLALLEAMRKGIPDCCGVAVGFDRLLQLRLGASEITSILSLTSNPGRLDTAVLPGTLSC
ncbi:MAG: EF-P lysine aminoacylase GenX [Verrucomicrobia bacterium]|nr:EF-P lysine aminoacylase GenX [Verrucomicrobiota bacterium]